MSLTQRVRIAQENLHAVLRAGHAWDDDQRWTAVIYVYGDLSGTERDSVLVAACYLGREQQWATAVAAWEITLADAGVSLFHATDFFSGRGEFQSAEWAPNEARHVEFARRFSSIADNAGLVGFAHALAPIPFTSILAPELQRVKRVHRDDHPRTHCVFRVVDQVAEFLAKANHPASRHIQLVFEEESGSGRYLNYFTESCERDERWTHWFGGFTVARKALVPLQIADLLAHETWRRAKKVLAEPDAQLRKSFERMLFHERIELKVSDETSLSQHADLVRVTLEKYPNGLYPDSWVPRNDVTPSPDDASAQG